jgi:hypothetical protein
VGLEFLIELLAKHGDDAERQIPVAIGPAGGY